MNSRISKSRVEIYSFLKITKIITKYSITSQNVRDKVTARIYMTLVLNNKLLFIFSTSVSGNKPKLTFLYLVCFSWPTQYTVIIIGYSHKKKSLLRLYFLSTVTCQRMAVNTLTIHQMRTFSLLYVDACNAKVPGYRTFMRIPVVPQNVANFLYWRNILINILI